MFLEELLRQEGRGTPRECPRCLMSTPSYRCSDCSSDALYCSDCLVETHRSMPFHRFQVRFPLSHIIFITQR
jgi:hypothetical protein